MIALSAAKLERERRWTPLIIPEGYDRRRR